MSANFDQLIQHLKTPHIRHYSSKHFSAQAMVSGVLPETSDLDSIWEQYAEKSGE